MADKQPLAWVWDYTAGKEQSEGYEHHEGKIEIFVRFDAEEGDWFWTAFNQIRPIAGESGYGSAEDAKADAQAWFEVEVAHG